MEGEEQHSQPKKGDELSSPLVVAKKYANIYGSIPSSFSSLIRGLIGDAAKGLESPSRNSQWQMMRLLKGSSIRAAMGYAIKTFNKPAMQTLSHFSAADMAAFYGPMDLAGMMASLYLFRRARRIQQSKQGSHWEYIVDRIHPSVEMGGHVGAAIPNIGLGTGLLVGGLRYLALWTFAFHDDKGFQAYKRHLKTEKEPWDLEYEMNRWGCSHAQVASNLLIACGFKTDLADAFVRGFSLAELCPEREDYEAYRVKITEVWLDSLLKTGNEPDIVHSGNFYPREMEKENLIKEAGESSATGSQFQWLDKGTANLTAEELPEFVPNDGEAGSPESSQVNQEAGSDSEGEEESVDAEELLEE